MLSWYRSQIAEHGARAATLLLLRVVWSRFKVTLANKILPPAHACPCCGWEGQKFHDYIEMGYASRGVECPRCNSHPRHRKLFLWLKNEFQPQRKTGTALLFAPEKSLSALWDAAPDLRVIRVDIEPSRGVDVLADIQRLPFAADSIDIVWCHHVLEAVENDRAAIAELYRVLRPLTGKLIISHAEGGKTVEFGYSNKRASGMWRAYGDDFTSRLADGGLTVHPIDYDLSPQERRRYGVYSEEKFYVCSKPLVDLALSAATQGSIVR
jgi:SAM-dependent methyltransferase